jgi:hypothetical protein
MTTFTTEDRESATQFMWPSYQVQKEIQFFWPLTEQIPLDLDYGPTHLYYSAQGIAGTSSIPILGSIYEFRPTITSYTTSINIDQTNITIISKNKQPLYRRVLYKLLGINWKTGD